MSFSELTRFGFRMFLVVALSASTMNAATQVDCAIVPINADTRVNVGVWIPANARVTNATVQVRTITPPDNYSDCSQAGLCPQPHADISNVAHWDVPDVGNARGWGYDFYNMKGAHTKYIKACVTYNTGPRESDEKTFELKPYDLLEECLKKKPKE
jgi:hypothetical protein